MIFVASKFRTNLRKLYFETPPPPSLSLNMCISLSNFLDRFLPITAEIVKIDAREESSWETFRVNGNEIPRILGGKKSKEGAEGIDVFR